ncbi:XTP/dITP diphosphatase [Geobacter sp. DSM 9736]|uniref:XTP/dITP diphosphatase n=1 Tax=Geobacter sp. DSM 9736 TaxID=1277350 RepID=UPI000B5106EE|nr:XTP/dITP diphosphatase [Geobacter sp. DSM 9736]
MRELVVATGNQGKLRELELLLHGTVEHLYSLRDYPGIPPVLEDGITFEENAIKKARTVAVATGKPTIADDSGLVVNALDGQPGVYSARFAGEDATDDDNNRKLLALMADVPDNCRSARFQCVIAYCLPDGACRKFSGELRGVLLKEPRGKDGFGYDPLFLVPEYGKTLAELPLHLKNRVSHRGCALGEFLSYIKEAG